ncbi:MAG: hypothetical protein JRH12_25740 [Deltaproteobacteria bacterium]|nr:hypothetical protein [Deltaproteobacteria bacterium]
MIRNFGGQLIIDPVFFANYVQNSDTEMLNKKYKYISYRYACTNFGHDLGKIHILPLLFHAMQIDGWFSWSHKLRGEYKKLNIDAEDGVREDMVGPSITDLIS